MDEQLSQQGFDHINPILPVWVPTEGATLRGYILGRQLDVGQEAFYIVQLTEPNREAITVQGKVSLEAGARVVVYETETMRACDKFIPHFQPVKQGMLTMQMPILAFEIVLVARANTRGTDAPNQVEIYSRRVNGPGAKPPIGQPPAPRTLPAIASSQIVRMKKARSASKPKPKSAPKTTQPS